MEKEIGEKLSALRRDVTRIRNSINKLRAEKERSYRRKGQLSDDIGTLIFKVKELRGKRDSITKGVKEKKGGRNKYNLAVKSGLEVVGSLQKEQQKLMKKHDMRLPSQIKKQIEDLDYKVETEGYTFEKEKEIMKKLKGLKSQLKKSVALGGIMGDIHSKKQDIIMSRKVARSLHSDMTAQSGESQKFHEEMIHVSKEIDKKKSERDVVAGRWMRLKEEIKKLNPLFKEKLMELAKVKIESDRLDSMKLKSKEEEVEIKIKKGGKLTNDDFIAFQDLLKK